MRRRRLRGRSPRRALLPGMAVPLPVGVEHVLAGGLPLLRQVGQQGVAEGLSLLRQQVKRRRRRRRRRRRTQTPFWSCPHPQEIRG
jgi:hypothetical protein